MLEPVRYGFFSGLRDRSAGRILALRSRDGFLAADAFSRDAVGRRFSGSSVLAEGL
jgi:hypothetical protein